MRAQLLRIFISFLGAVAVAHVAAAATPQPVQGGQNAPTPSAGASAPRVNAAEAAAFAQEEYLRNMSIRVGVIGPSSLQSLDLLCPTRHIGVSSAPLSVLIQCTPF